MTGRYLLWRLLQVPPVAAGIVIVGFLLIHLAPGDPVLALAGEHGDADYYAFMRERFGLDQPLPNQLITYATRVATGDFGYSYVHGRGVLAVIGERAPVTLLLTGTALILALVVAIPLGLFAALRTNGARDAGLNIAALGLYSAPVFWVGQLALLVFALRLGLFPAHGMTSPGGAAGGAGRVLDVLHHLALPALVLASQQMAALFRLTRNGVAEELERDYIRTARAKGLRERTVVLRHALRRSMLPVVTVIGVRMGHLIAGAVIVEIVFGWPGIGRLLLTALQTRDTPILLGLFFVVSLTVLLANLITDLLYAAVDPRVRHR